ncbi:uncharacterized protein WM294_005632 [Sarcoramphus papa]
MHCKLRTGKIWGYFSQLFSFLLVISPSKAVHRTVSGSRSLGILSIWWYRRLFSATHKAPKAVGGREFSFYQQLMGSVFGSQVAKGYFLKQLLQLPCFSPGTGDGPSCFVSAGAGVASGQRHVSGKRARVHLKPAQDGFLQM